MNTSSIKAHADIETDMQIIARERLRILKLDGLIPSDNPEPEIAPFKCAQRGYLCSGGAYLIMFIPGVIDVDTCAESILEVTDGTIECWTLENDSVVDYFEYSEEAEGSGQAH